MVWAFQVMKGIRCELPMISMKIKSLHLRHSRRIDKCRVPFQCSTHALLTLLFLLLHTLMTLIYLLYHLIYGRLCVLSLIFCLVSFFSISFIILLIIELVLMNFLYFCLLAGGSTCNSRGATLGSGGAYAFSS